ncbi:type II and III secretion system protein [Pseudothauera nasutitermitis]|uniref:Type IV pilus biogenesis and competence protein PilQ n=1 Tax=Pseudothauera nasutitermitis TaxID=2565930 RepID=A0A4V3WBU2_9RHOO|nr:pilus assembly protein N-terminal domain-containing protein [Pseudothauera nasutitermitis]THF64569.1 type II and III secretion system protein [Pseudothauera nasutitermitis]
MIREIRLAAPRHAKPLAILALTILAPHSDVQAQHGGQEVRRFAESWYSSAPAGAPGPNAPIPIADDQAAIPEIEMFVGETRVFPAPMLARIAVGNGQIMSAASLDDKEVIVFANAAGTSSLFIWNQDGSYQRVKINIVAGDTTRVAREIAAFLSAIPNATASVIGDKVIVEGEELNDHDLAKIDELAKRYPQIVNFTNRAGWDQMVLMDVKVVEFPTNELREIGLKWGPTGGFAIGGMWSPISRRSGNRGYTIDLITGTDNAAPIGSVDDSTSVPLSSGLNVLSVLNMGLNAQLNLLAQDGKASILAEPQLSARNGSTATFLAGGEYPYTVSTINGPTVMFKPYGVKLEITPQVSRHGIIRATIDSEVSAIDTSMSTTAGPGLTSRRTSTEFNVRDGETLVLAGLLNRNNSESIDKLPFLGDLPIIGALFRSKRFQNDETELVVFVTPHVVDSRSPGLVDRVERTTERLERNIGKPAYLNSPHEALPRSTPSPEAAVAEETPPPADAARVENQPPPVNQRVVSDSVVIHELPNRASAILARPRKGSVLVPVSNEVVGGWRQIRLEGGAIGWVADRGLSPTIDTPRTEDMDDLPPARRMAARPVSVPVDGTPPPGAWYRVGTRQNALRVSPDINAEPVAWLAAGSEVEALLQNAVDGWLPVRSGEHRGWIWGQSLQPIHAEVP